LWAERKAERLLEFWRTLRRVKTHGRIAGIVRAMQAAISSEGPEVQSVTTKDEREATNQ
jgi:hypothetical protein